MMEAVSRWPLAIGYWLCNVCYPKVISPKKVGWWKLGSGVWMGLHEMKWGTKNEIKI